MDYRTCLRTTTALASAAFGLIAAPAWNAAIEATHALLGDAPALGRQEGGAR